MCGVIGVIGPKKEQNHAWAAYEAYNGLLTLQHRGQDAAGILSFDEQKFHLRKDLGLVPNVFDQSKLDQLVGAMAIGHTRYATTGVNDVSDLQPMVTELPFGVGMAHNGNLVNYYELARNCAEKLQIQLKSTNDLEIFIALWCHALQQNGIPHQRKMKIEDAVLATKHIFEQADGAYAVVGLVADLGLFAFRDPKGLRPLVLGQKETPEGTQYCITSETSALSFLDYEPIRDIRPGELLFINATGRLFSSVVQDETQKAHCMFEWVYFAGAQSTLDNRSVYRARLNLGKALARRVKQEIDNGLIKPDIICPVPHTSRPATISLSEEMRIPYREVFIKNRYIQRSFILSSQEAREQAVQLKLSPIGSEIKGKNILLVDDSVVRGTTSRNIVTLLKQYGAQNISLAITCPPIRYGCFYGIDFPDQKELIAANRELEEVAEWIGVDKIIYLEPSDLEEAIGTKELCMGCIKGQYPTQNRGSAEFAQKRRARPSL